MTILTQANHQWSSRPDDERFTSLHALHSFVTHQRDRSRELVVSSRKITCEPVPNDEAKGLQIVGPNGAAYAPTHWAFGQLCQRVSAPAGYLGTLPAAMAADCLNYGLQFERGPEDVGILLRKPNGEAGELAACTGPNYGRIWNGEITGRLVERFGNGVDDHDWRIPGEFGPRAPGVAVTKQSTTLYASDRDLWVFLADEHNRIEIPNRRDGRRGSLARGFFVWNSETGSKTFGFGQFLYDYMCCNHLIWGAQMYKELRIRHTVSAPDKFVSEIEPTLRQISHDSTTPIVDTIAAAQAQKVQDLAQFLKRRNFAQNMTAKLQATHEREEGRPIESLWDVAVGLTALAKSVPYTDKRVELEREAGKVLDLVVA